MKKRKNNVCAKPKSRDSRLRGGGCGLCGCVLCGRGLSGGFGLGSSGLRSGGLCDSSVASGLRGLGSCGGGLGGSGGSLGFGSFSFGSGGFGFNCGHVGGLGSNRPVSGLLEGAHLSQRDGGPRHDGLGLRLRPVLRHRRRPRDLAHAEGCPVLDRRDQIIFQGPAPRQAEHQRLAVDPSDIEPNCASLRTRNHPPGGEGWQLRPGQRGREKPKEGVAQPGRLIVLERLAGAEEREADHHAGICVAQGGAGQQTAGHPLARQATHRVVERLDDQLKDQVDLVLAFGRQLAEQALGLDVADAKYDLKPLAVGPGRVDAGDGQRPILREPLDEPIAAGLVEAHQTMGGGQTHPFPIATLRCPALARVPPVEERHGRGVRGVTVNH